MATGLQTFDALKTAIINQDAEEFFLHPADLNLLIMLKPEDLKKRNYDESVAEDVCSALFKKDFSPLGKSLGIKLKLKPDAARLILP